MSARILVVDDESYVRDLLRRVLARRGHEVDVAADGGPQAMTPDGWLAVPVIESPRSGAVVGDRVQVASDGFVVSADAIVVGGFDNVTVLAVPANEAPLLPAAADAGALTLLLKP